MTFFAGTLRTAADLGGLDLRLVVEILFLNFGSEIILFLRQYCSCFASKFVPLEASKCLSPS